MRLKHRAEYFRNIVHVGLAVAVGAHEFKRRKPHAFHPLLAHVQLHHGCRHKLPLCEHDLLLALPETVVGKRPHQRETLVKTAYGLLQDPAAGIQIGEHPVLTVLEMVDGIFGTVDILAVQITRDLHKRVCSARHG